ncbi:phosphopyruvate hydratase [Thermocladium modestius]|nr:enolase C-terminal domain-like protein [Thermocladium modestius]
MSSIDDAIIRKSFTGRGDQTVEVELILESGVRGLATAPAGASKGKHEVQFLPQDGVDAAIDMFRRWVATDLIGMDAVDQGGIDAKLEEVDGTPNFARIGGASAFATSLAAASAASNYLEMPLYKYLGGALASSFPYPVSNVIGGGKHSRNLGPDFQEFLVIPYGAPDIYSAVSTNLEIHKEVGKELAKEDPTFAGGKNDEGAWTAKISTIKALSILSTVVKKKAEEKGFAIGIGIDAAASGMWNGEKYEYRSEGKERSAEEHMEFIKQLVDEYNIVYFEDPLHEEDFDGFAELTAALRGKCLIVGDDLFVTNSSRLRMGIEKKAGNGIIIKVDQVGTLSRAFETVKLAKENGYTIVVSHRSGDTERELLAHVALGFQSPLIKTGIVGGERMAKLNELIRMWEAEGKAAHMSKSPFK